jgi:hypothetical protein
MVSATIEAGGSHPVSLISIAVRRDFSEYDFLNNFIRPGEDWEHYTSQT